MSGLGKLHSLNANEKFITAFEKRALTILHNIKKSAQWEAKPSTHSGALLRVLILESLGKYGDKKTISKAQKMFAAVNEKTNKIPADLRGAVYNTVARYGSAKEYAKLIKLYKVATLHEEKNRIGRALGIFRQENLLEKTLTFAISEHVRRQDSVRMIAVVAVNPKGRDIAWKFIKKNWGRFVQRFVGSRDLLYLLEPLGVSSSVKRAKEIRQFLKKNPAPGTERTVQQVLERINSNAAWLARDRKRLAAFLR